MWGDGEYPVDLGDDDEVTPVRAGEPVDGAQFYSANREPYETMPEGQNNPVNLEQNPTYPPYALLVAALSAQSDPKETVALKAKTPKGYGALEEEQEESKAGKPHYFYYGPSSEGFNKIDLLPEDPAHMPRKVLQDLRYLQNRELELFAYRHITHHTKHARKYLKIFQNLVQQRNQIFNLIETKYVEPAQPMNSKRYHKLMKRYAKAYGKVTSKLSKAQRAPFNKIFIEHNDHFVKYLGSVHRNEHQLSGMSDGTPTFINGKDWENGPWASYYQGTLKDPHKVFYMSEEAASILDSNINMDVVKNAVEAIHACMKNEYRSVDNVMREIGVGIQVGDGPFAHMEAIPKMMKYLENPNGAFTNLKRASNVFQRTTARLKRFNNTTSVYALSASKVDKYWDSFLKSNRQNIVTRFYKGTRLIFAAVIMPAAFVTLKALDLLTGKSIFCLRKTAKTLRSLKKGYRVKRSLFKLAGMGAGSLTAAVIGGGCGMGLAWGIGAVGMATYGTAFPAYAAWLIGASVGGTLGLSVGAYSGWMTSKYIAKIVSKVFRNDTNPDKKRLTKKERKYLANKDFDLDQVELALSSLYNEKHEKNILSRITPNGMAKKRRLNRSISDIKRGLLLKISLNEGELQLRKERDPVKGIEALGKVPKEKVVDQNADYDEDTTILLDRSSSIAPVKKDQDLLEPMQTGRESVPPPLEQSATSVRERNISQVPPLEPLPPAPQDRQEGPSDGDRDIERMLVEEGMNVDDLSAALRERAAEMLIEGKGDDQESDDGFVPPPPPPPGEETDTAPLLGSDGIVEVTAENPGDAAGMFADRGRKNSREGSCHSGVRSRSPSPLFEI